MDPHSQHGIEAEDSPGPGCRVRLLSYNIQAGIETTRYREYVTKGWMHLVPHPERLVNMNRIAGILSGYDIVGLQEVDAGSLRSGFLDMTEYLAHRAGFPLWYKQVNRNIGVLARHSNGFLTKFEPDRVTHHRLPAGPGRGAMLVEFGHGSQALWICSMHLALSRRARVRQLSFVRELLGEAPNIVVMGDLNAGCHSIEMQHFLDAMGLREPAGDQYTFPSWRPIRKLDHILVSEHLQVIEAKVLDYAVSDHLPISVELELPWALELAA